MQRYCDVAVPVPLDATFTYSIPDESPDPCVGGRVIVPFREKRLCGIVTELHDREPKFAAKPIQRVLDMTPALTPELMQLGRWIAHYYIAPIGEVFRTMLPLTAEFRRVMGYRITGKGMEALHAASTVGSSLRARVQPEQQMQEYAVLNRLADGEVMREGSLRSAASASRRVLLGLLRKKWIAREDLSGVRDASRNVQVATLKRLPEDPGKHIPCGLKPPRDDKNKGLYGKAEAVPFQSNTAPDEVGEAMPRHANQAFAGAPFDEPGAGSEGAPQQE